MRHAVVTGTHKHGLHIYVYTPIYNNYFGMFWLMIMAVFRECHYRVFAYQVNIIDEIQDILFQPDLKNNPGQGFSSVDTYSILPSA
jgi:hypothetical protein